MLESCGLVKLDYNALKININMTVALHWSESYRTHITVSCFPQEGK